MSLENPIYQIIQTIQQKNNILIATKANASGDGIASCLAFKSIAQLLNKNADIVIDNAALGLKNKFSFLPEFETILQSPQKKGPSIIKLNLGENKIKKISYKIENKELQIKLDPENENHEFGKPAILKARFDYDLIIVLDARDLESLGRVYDENHDLFYKMPIINVDHRANNDHFGAMNLIDLTCVSTTEVIYNLAQEWDKTIINENIATCLLTGILSESKSFQKSNITPQTLAIAGNLINMGAKREKISEKIFSNKPINTLRIWGRALSNLKTDPENKIIWSQIQAKDFSETETEENDLKEIIDDLLSHVPNAQAVLVAFSSDKHSKVVCYTNKNEIDLRKILSPLDATGARNMVEISLPNSNLEQNIENVKKILINRWPKETLIPQF